MGVGGTPGIGGLGIGGGGGRPPGTGGMPGTGGSRGTGGSPPAVPKLITSAPNAYWNTSGTITTVTTGNATVTVNDGTTMKTFEGFGGAFNEIGWNVLSMLSASDRDRAMKLLFDATDGAHFVMGRIPIGASDYALQRYTDDETANDTSLNSFSITQDMKYLIPYVKAAQAINGSIRFWASPWTPPTWMKTNSGTVSGTSCAKAGNTAFDGGCMQDIAANLTALAQYFVKWIQAYAAQQITIETLAPQNEPNYAQGYPSALWAPALYTKFIPILNTALTGAGLSTKIMLGTMSNGDNGATSKDLMVVQAVMADATAKTLVKVMGLQWGMLDLYEGKTSGVSPSTFNTSSISSVWATEHKCGNYPWNPSGYPKYVEPAPNDQAYGVESWGYIRDAIKAGVTAYDAWNMVLDTVGKGNDTARQWSQDTLLAVNTSSKTLILTPAYHVFRHVSQYVQAGAKVVSTSGGDALGFKNPDGSVVAAMYNSGGASTYIVQIKGQKLQFSMPGTGWATVVVP
jgi:glucosylceramidase